MEDRKFLLTMDLFVCSAPNVTFSPLFSGKQPDRINKRLEEELKTRTISEL
jgi:hypothetical protein